MPRTHRDAAHPGPAIMEKAERIDRCWFPLLQAGTGKNTTGRRCASGPAAERCQARKSHGRKLAFSHGFSLSFLGWKPSTLSQPQQNIRGSIGQYPLSNFAGCRSGGVLPNRSQFPAPTLLKQKADTWETCPASAYAPACLSRKGGGGNRSLGTTERFPPRTFRASQPFTAPTVMPLTKYFCRKG